MTFEASASGPSVAPTGAVPTVGGAGATAPAAPPPPSSPAPVAPPAAPSGSTSSSSSAAPSTPSSSPRAAPTTGYVALKYAPTSAIDNDELVYSEPLTMNPRDATKLIGVDNELGGDAVPLYSMGADGDMTLLQDGVKDVSFIGALGNGAVNFQFVRVGDDPPSAVFVSGVTGDGYYLDISDQGLNLNALTDEQKQTLSTIPKEEIENAMNHNPSYNFTLTNG